MDSSMIEKAHVICCNDSTELVVLNDIEKAKLEMENAKKDYFERNKHRFKDYKEYDHICFWHIHTVNVK